MNEARIDGFILCLDARNWFGLYPNRGAHILFSGTHEECLFYRKHGHAPMCACGGNCPVDASIGMPLCTAQELGDV